MKTETHVPPLTIYNYNDPMKHFSHYFKLRATFMVLSVHQLFWVKLNAFK